MRFFEVVFSGAALIAAVLAVEFNDVPKSVEAGQTYTITYSPKDNTPTTITLRKGDPNNLDTLATLTTSATGGSFKWTVDSSLANADDYALEIQQAGGEPNYSGLIPLTGGSDEEPSSSGTPSATPSKTGSSASSTAAGTTTAKSTLTTAASSTPSPSSGSNGTVSTGSPSSTESGSPVSTGGASQTTGGNGPPESTGAAAILGSSPLALVFGAVAAMAYLN